MSLSVDAGRAWWLDLPRRLVASLRLGMEREWG
jgi:hypothetical protein